jgi:hypothetical protein
MPSTIFTPEQIEEFQYAMEGPAYWMEFFMEGTPYDEEALDTIHENRFTVCDIDELTGLFYILWEANFKPHQRIAILSPTQRRAEDVLGWIVGYLATLPDYLKMEVVAKNKKRLELSNGSIIDALAPYYTSLRGCSYSTIYFDNFARVLPDVEKDFFTNIFPTVSCGCTKVIINYGKRYFDVFRGNDMFVKVRC